jgi:hypothetical protein
MGLVKGHAAGVYRAQLFVTIQKVAAVSGQRPERRLQERSIATATVFRSAFASDPGTVGEGWKALMSPGADLGWVRTSKEFLPICPNPSFLARGS